VNGSLSADPNSRFSVKVRESASTSIKLTPLHVNSYFGTMPSVLVVPAFSSRFAIFRVGSSKAQYKIF